MLGMKPSRLLPLPPRPGDKQGVAGLALSSHQGWGRRILLQHRGVFNPLIWGWVAGRAFWGMLKLTPDLQGTQHSDSIWRRPWGRRALSVGPGGQTGSHRQLGPALSQKLPCDVGFVPAILLFIEWPLDVWQLWWYALRGTKIQIMQVGSSVLSF